MFGSATPKTTLVTGLWDIGRENLSDRWSRSFSRHYLVNFKNLLEHIKRFDDPSVNVIIFGEKNLKDFLVENKVISSFSSDPKILFIERSLTWFKQNEYYDFIQKIRNDSSWVSRAGWLKYSVQAKLELYNPIVMSKIFLLNDAKLLDPFNSDYLFWIDAGITNTVSPHFFTSSNSSKRCVVSEIPKIMNKTDFMFICFPYQAAAVDGEIHGFEYAKINEMTMSTVDKVARGGFFGGKKDAIQRANGIYYDLLLSTLKSGLMGTEESLFTILVYNFPEIFSFFKIESNGLIYKFFEDVRNNQVECLQQSKTVRKTLSLTAAAAKSPQMIDDEAKKQRVGLYVITFNSPKQFETLLISMEKYDKDFIREPKRKILLDNSTDLSTTPKYASLCKKYGFEHIKKTILVFAEEGNSYLITLKKLTILI